MIKISCLGLGGVLVLAVCGCGMTERRVSLTTPPEFPVFSYEAHRGGRGLFPENSIVAMKAAIDLPRVTTLEMDCHITKDHQVVVYHDDYINPKFVRYQDGSELRAADSKAPVYGYTYEQLQAFDIGTKYYPDFPEQQKIRTPISLLSDLIDSAENYAATKRNKPMFYNIEIKSNAGKDGRYHPVPAEFGSLLLKVIIDKGIAPRTVIQSFDKRALQYIHEAYPDIRTSYLINEKNSKTASQLIDELGFKPYIISPHDRLVSEAFVNEAHRQGLKVIPWTVNDTGEIKRLIDMRVDGLISDYPNLF